MSLAPGSPACPFVLFLPLAPQLLLAVFEDGVPKVVAVDVGEEALDPSLQHLSLVDEDDGDALEDDSQFAQGHLL